MKFLGRNQPTLAPLRIPCFEPDASQRIAQQMRNGLQELGYCEGEPVLIMCIGTDRSTGDALGPLTGTLLNGYSVLHSDVRGTLEAPVHATNLSQELETLQNNRDSRLIIAVDACLGQTAQVGTICVVTGPIRPGAGVNKALPSVGDLYLTGTVNVGGFMEYLVLQNTRLSLVVKMAGVLAHSIAEVFGPPSGLYRPQFVV